MALLDPSEIRKRMIITVHGIKPQPVKLEQEHDHHDPHGIMTQLTTALGGLNMGEIAWSQRMQGVPLVVQELELPYIVVSMYNRGDEKRVSLDTRVTELMEVDKQYADAMCPRKSFLEKLAFWR